MKNMKIEINDEQPLDEVVAELEKRGYKDVSLGFESKEYGVFIDTESKLWCLTCSDHDDTDLTTLVELKEM